MLRLDSAAGNGYTMYNSDKYAADDGLATYSSHPFLLVRGSSENQWYGIYMVTSNTADAVFENDGILTFRMAGGVIEMHVLSGSRPAEVVSLYQSIIGISGFLCKSVHMICMLTFP